LGSTVQLHLGAGIKPEHDEAENRKPKKNSAGKSPWGKATIFLSAGWWFGTFGLCFPLILGMEWNNHPN